MLSSFTDIKTSHVVRLSDESNFTASRWLDTEKVRICILCMG